MATVEDHLRALEEAQKEYEKSLENLDKPKNNGNEEGEAEQENVEEDPEACESKLSIDPYHRAIEYLEEHNILHLFQKMTSNIVFYRPDDPVQYIIDEVDQIAESINTTDIKE